MPHPPLSSSSRLVRSPYYSLGRKFSPEDDLARKCPGINLEEVEKRKTAKTSDPPTSHQPERGRRVSLLLFLTPTCPPPLFYPSSRCAAAAARVCIPKIVFLLTTTTTTTGVALAPATFITFSNTSKPVRRGYIVLLLGERFSLYIRG